MQTKRTIQALLESAGVRPNKRFGQHFLIDGNLMRKLVEAASVRGDDVALEVGCGTGSLTQMLAETAGAVVGVEVDRTLADIAAEQVSGLGNVVVLHRDVLASKNRIDEEVLEAVRSARQRCGGRLLLIANLPYQVASPLLIDLLVGSLVPAVMCVTIQKEVGDRIVARPAGRSYGPLSVIGQCLATVERIAAAPPQAFWPSPAVESVLLRITPEPSRRKSLGDIDAFVRLVKGCFRHRRKTLGYNLTALCGNGGRAAEMLDAAGLDPKARPETVAPEGWSRLAGYVPETR